MNQQTFGHERRITTRLLAYWEKLRRGRLMPGEEEINPSDIHELWDNCFLIRVKDVNPEDYRYTFLGPAIIEAYRGTLAGDEKLDGIISPNAGKLAVVYAQIIATRKPMIEDGEFKNHAGEMIRYRQCLLPLGKENRVSAIFGAMRFKIFQP